MPDLCLPRRHDLEFKQDSTAHAVGARFSRVVRHRNIDLCCTGQDFSSLCTTGGTGQSLLSCLKQVQDVRLVSLE